jgi:formylglycine-generating enzyme required for sulfatase activity
VDLARIASRTWYEEEYVADDVGFRCVADPPDRVPAEQLVQLAGRAFPIDGEGGSELELSDLAGSDRRYLQRRALTWLVVEGRVEVAVPRVVNLLRQDPRDQVLQDLLAQLEEEMVDGIRRGDLRTVRAAIDGYRSAASGDRRMMARLADFEGTLAGELAASGRSFAGRGEYRLVDLTSDLARVLAPGGPALSRDLARLAEPAAGTRRVSGRDGKLMVWVPAGTFRMGASPDDGSAGYDEHPAHAVSVAGFWLDATEVTNAEYRRCVDAEVCNAPLRLAAFDDPKLADHPVLWLTWFQAATYARWAGKRLPTEAEWERAARGGSADRYPWGNDWRPGAANSVESADRDRYNETAPVASFSATAWGLHDMLGNAAEWVADVYHRNYWDAPSDGRAWNQLTGEWTERHHVIRGGSYVTTPARLRVSFREHRAPRGSSRALGFRCAADK